MWQKESGTGRIADLIPEYKPPQKPSAPKTGSEQPAPVYAQWYVLDTDGNIHGAYTLAEAQRQQGNGIREAAYSEAEALEKFRERLAKSQIKKWQKARKKLGLE